ncbi:hypothetical protein ACLEDK_16945 [Lonsdalea quercina]|uniref:hypothetical protein n=1 Tax=Lonsdalea quercina TaxID=71657 RepID=UPI00397524A0
MSKVIDFPTEKEREEKAKAIRARRNKKAVQRSNISSCLLSWVKKVNLLIAIKLSARFFLLYCGLIVVDILIYFLFILGKILKLLFAVGSISVLLLLFMEYKNGWHHTQSIFHIAAIFVSLISLRIGHDKLLNALIRLKSYLSRKW